MSPILVLLSSPVAALVILMLMAKLETALLSGPPPAPRPAARPSAASVPDGPVLSIAEPPPAEPAELRSAA
ncbi:hypothetical protein [Actinomadura fibrosa]|uniref:Secreted protein n=1 Tax=Actinomadura fibrosa TaxID=111802 RepID=A0ABW2XWM7_9ACTN|nr:hypothetical protein [Actinomadura fibrosa]